ncbi:MAG: hypothetical protein AAGG75_18545 [Bacteroidota bacterium]
MKKLVTAIIVSLLAHLFALNLIAQDQGYIYGKITTFDNETYTGQIRWGKEEAFWTDMFDASKIFNENTEYLSKEEFKDLAERKVESWGRWKNGKNNEEMMAQVDFTHQLSCQFGEIKSLDMRRYKRVELTFRNGARFRVSGENYNDIGTEIRMYDPQKGEVELNWTEVVLIEFMSPPADFKSAIGTAIYGTVRTQQGDFSGFIQWDKDERMSSDKLDGRTKSGKKSIEFSDIALIEKWDKGANVKLHSGEEFYTYGTNDVNAENRGILITNEEIGRVEIDWSDFIEVSFSQQPEGSLKPYNQFKDPAALRGIVRTNSGKTLRGNIVFDLDEEFDFEMLNGEQGDSEYHIPFRNIKKIVPQGKRQSTVILRSNHTIKLDSSQDVNSKNDGLLVFDDGKDPEYVSWKDLKEIEFTN